MRTKNWLCPACQERYPAPAADRCLFCALARRGEEPRPEPAGEPEGDWRSRDVADIFGPPDEPSEGDGAEAAGSDVALIS